MEITVGQSIPRIRVSALVGDAVKELELGEPAGSWLVLYFYPKDDTSVCRSENEIFRARLADFEELGTKLMAASVDTIDAHRRWRDSGLGELPYPWIADHSKELTSRMGALHEDTGLALRATFIIDPDGIVRFLCVHDLAVGRNVDEILRTLHALQTGKPTQCNWRPGEPTL